MTLSVIQAPLFRGLIRPSGAEAGDATSSIHPRAEPTLSNPDSPHTGKSMNAHWIRICLLLLLFVVPGGAQSSMSRRVEISALRLSYSDLAEIVASVHRYVETVRTPADSATRHYSSESLSISDGTTTLGFGMFTSDSSLRAAPPIAYNASYSFATGVGAITGVSFELHDSYREFAVTGRSPEQVAGLVALLTSAFADHASFFGGFSFRTIGGMILWMLAWVGAIAASLLKSRRRWAAGVVALVLFLSIWSFPWSHWFPGTAIISGEAAFLVRYAPQVSFVGALLGVLSLLIGLFPWSPKGPVVHAPESPDIGSSGEAT